MVQQIQLDLDFAPLLAADYLQHSGSCIQHQVHELQDIHNQYGGFPASYSINNTLIHQLWWTADQLDFDYIGQQLNMQVITVSTICQPPGNVVPWHRDTFYQIRKRFPDRSDTPVRANIYMQDWKMGHFIQFDNTVSTHWTAGQGFLWDSSVLHLGANAGFENKYTMQVSGFLR